MAERQRNGYRRKTSSLCLHRGSCCAPPLKLEYDVQGVDDTLEDALVNMPREDGDATDLTGM